MCFCASDAKRFEQLLRAIYEKAHLSEEDYKFLKDNYYPEILLEHHKEEYVSH